VYPVVTNLVYW